MSIKTKIESLLFVSDRPLSAEDILKAFDKGNSPSREEVKKNLEEIFTEYKERNDGIIVIKNLGKYQMSSSPENADVVQNFLGDETTEELTRPQLETLTTIAYRGALTKAELEQIRGVNCSLVIRNLMVRGLIEADEQKNQMPKFSVTLDFIKFLGVRKVEELPDYEKLHNHEIINEILEK